MVYYYCIININNTILFFSLETIYFFTYINNYDKKTYTKTFKKKAFKKN